MATISDDFTIDYVNKRIYHSANNNVYTVNELYTYLQDTFDDLEQMDDTIPMSAQTPTDYTLTNGWFMDDDSFKYLKKGAIQTNSYTNEIYVLTFGTYPSNLAATDIGKVLDSGAGAKQGRIMAYNDAAKKIWVRKITGTFANSDSCTITGGTAGTYVIAASSGVATGEDLFPNVYTLGSIREDDSQKIYIVQNKTRITEWWPETGAGTRHIDVLIKIKEAGSEIDSGNLTIFLRHYPDGAGKQGDLYDHFEIDVTPGGRNAVPLATADDLNNTTQADGAGNVNTYSDIKVIFVNGTIPHGSITGTFTDYETITQTNNPGVSGIFIKTESGVMTLGNIIGVFNGTDQLVGNPSGATATASSTVTVVNTTPKAFEQDTARNYSVLIWCANRKLTQVYEYTKYITRYTNDFDTYGIKSVSGTLSQNVLDGEQYITAYIDETTPGNTYSPSKQAPFGTFAGGKFFGARGIWLEAMDPADVQAFQLIDSGGTTREPPNKQSITITNLVSGDRVSVFKTVGFTSPDDTTIKKDMYSLASGNNIGNNTIVVNETITENTPGATTGGVIRLVDTSDLGATRETRYTYTGWNNSTFTGVSPTLDRTYTASDDKAYVPFIDKETASTSETVQVIYKTIAQAGQGDQPILIRVRRRATPDPILPFQATGTFGDKGFSISAIRTPDTIVGLP